MSISLVTRILILSVGSGAICAANTLLMLILLLKGSAGAFPVASELIGLQFPPVFNFLSTIQGRVYALSILANFLLGIPGQRAGQIPTLSFGLQTGVSSVAFRSTSAPSAQNASNLTPDRATFVGTSTLPSNVRLHINCLTETI
jgi:hypothetical protein